MTAVIVVNPTQATLPPSHSSPTFPTSTPSSPFSSLSSPPAMFVLAVGWAFHHAGLASSFSKHTHTYTHMHVCTNTYIPYSVLKHLKHLPNFILSFFLSLFIYLFIYFLLSFLLSFISKWSFREFSVIFSLKPRPHSPFSLPFFG